MAQKDKDMDPRQDQTLKSANPQSGGVQRQRFSGSDHLDWTDRQDFDDAVRGCVAGLPDLVIHDDQGNIVWDSRPHDAMLGGDCPETVNPSLWRIAQLNNIRGLFKVAEGVWQVRGHSLANMTFVEGQTGWIVIDPATTIEVAKVGLDLINRELGSRPVIGVVYSHTHSDHWGGVAGTSPRSDARVIAPEGFAEFVLAESLVASEGLGPRNAFMYGEHLRSGPCGHVDCGLGKATEGGRLSYLAPTDLIGPAGGELTIDGVEMHFQFAPGEAPTGMHIYLPRQHVLHVADNCYASLHNIYTIRGALSRDAALWSASVGRALEFEAAEIIIGGHHWPRWGKERARDFLTQQRDALKFLHDQAVRLMKLGYTAHEAANTIELPRELARQWHLRGYYGTIAQNVRGIIHHYLGWYDGNPATLHPLPPREAAAKLIDYMGGVDRVLERAQADFKAGNHRWVLQILDQVLWLDPDNTQVRSLAAAAARELGFAAENATWRNAYLSAEQELSTSSESDMGAIRDASDLSLKLPVRSLLDYLGVRVIAPMAEEYDLRIVWSLTDTGERFPMRLRNAVLTFDNEGATSVEISLDRATLAALVYEQVDPKLLSIAVTGDRSVFEAFWSVMEVFPKSFPIASHAHKRYES